MKVVFLGTGGTIPTEERRHPCLAIRREGDLFLFDCGEGAQTQISKARLGTGSLCAILLSHLHGDHVLGLPGLLMTMNQNNRIDPLVVIGPPGVAKWIDHIYEDFCLRPSFPVPVNEVGPGPVLVTPQYRIKAFPLRHSILTLGYCLEEAERPGRFQVDAALRLGVPKGPLWRQLQSGLTIKISGEREVHPQEVLGPSRPGIKVVYAVDSRPSPETVQAALAADLLIHDGMFLSEDFDKARNRGHSTVTEAAGVALASKARRLALTHLSPRYRGKEDHFLKQARQVFPETVVAEDLLEIEIRRPDG